MFVVKKIHDMKILQIGPYPPPVGGWSFHIKVFKKYLDSLNIPNDVLDIGENRTVKGRECVDVQGIVDYSEKVFAYCKQRYCIYVHLNGNSVVGIVLTVIAQLIALITFQKCLLSFHAGTLQDCFRKGLSISKVLVFVAFRISAGIICNSEAVKKQILKFGIPPEQVFSIPCFSVQYIQHEYALSPQEEEYIETHHPILSSYLFFRDEYDPDTLIDSFRLIKKKYPTFGALIIGSLDGSERYQQKIKEYQLEEQVLLVGEKQHDNFLTIVESSDLVLRTPVSDGVCSSVMEALALKVPVIASDNGTRPDDVILFEPGNAEDLAQKVIFTMQNIDQAQERLANVVQRDTIQEELEFLTKYTDK